MGIDLGIMRVMSDLVSRMTLGRGLGQSFGGKRDYYKVFGYQETLTSRDLQQRYARQGIASRIVDAPAQALWDNPPIVSSNDEAWNQAWNRLVTKHALWEVILRLDKLAGLGRYSCMLIGVNDAMPTKNAGKPSTKAGNLREVLYLQVYSQESAQIKQISADANSPQYMLPEMYTISPFKQAADVIAGNVALPATSFEAHFTRILHLAENTLENEVFGSPRLERVYNDLDDLLKVSGGTSENYWLTANRGMQVDIDKDMELDAEDAKNLSDELDEYVHQLRRVLRTRGVKINNLGSDVPNPEQTFNMLIALLAGATGIPRRILIGAEAGQLASEQDRANWAERVELRRAELGEPKVIFPLIGKLTALGVLPSNDSLQITVTWPDAYRLSPLEIAQKSAQHARSATNFARAVDVLVKLKQGKPGTEDITDAEGNIIPGEPAQEGEDYTMILSVPWMQQMLGQTPTKPQLDDTGDLIK